PDYRGGIRCGDRLSGAQSQICIGRAEYHAHHQSEQHGAERELLHLDVRRDEGLVRTCRGRSGGWGHARRAFTFAPRILPSTGLPASFACAAFITSPICFAVVAPVSAMAASTAAFRSSSLAAAGR